MCYDREEDILTMSQWDETFECVDCDWMRFLDPSKLAFGGGLILRGDLGTVVHASLYVSIHLSEL
jgi:hypothetical protein